MSARSRPARGVQCHWPPGASGAAAGVRFGMAGNTRSVRAVWLVFAVVLSLLGAAACQKSQRRTAAEESLARAIAVVNNEKISYEAFQNDYQLFLTRWDPFILHDPEKKQEIKELLLNRMIEAKLIDQEARRKGIEVDTEELNARILALIASREQGETDAETIVAQEQLVEWRRKFRRRIIHEKVVRQEVIEKIRITPAELRSYYNKQRQRFYRPERVKVRHIAVGSRSLYNRVMNLLERRRKFTSLVRKYSITPDRFADGELGYVERGVLPEEFDEAIFKMSRIGSISPRRSPVQTQMGYHIFRLEGRQKEGLLSYRLALPEIRKLLMEQKQSQAFGKWLTRLRKRATIHIDNDLLLAD